MNNNIYFYWDGLVGDSRLKILKDCVYSTKVFNPNHNIIIVTNSLSDNIFDKKFDVKILNWDISFFENTPVPLDIVKNFYLQAYPREMSDLMRMVILYKYGGSYIDTDDLAIKPISNNKNVICRCYDPHTCHYNNLDTADCISGVHRDITGYDDIPFFPRNDCWLNFEPEHHIIKEILSHHKFISSNKAIYIGDDFSWQSITLDVIKNNIDKLGKSFQIGLNLLYLYEDFVSASSYWDRCLNGGEMCDVYKTLKNINEYDWGFYKCEENVALDFYNSIIKKYPNLSHMWLHSKDMKEEWLIDDYIDDNYCISTWIYKYVKEKIKLYESIGNNANIWSHSIFE